MQSSPRTSHKPVTYGRSSRYRYQRLTSDLSGPSLIANPDKQQGYPNMLPRSGSIRQTTQPRRTSQHERQWTSTGFGAEKDAQIGHPLPAGHTYLGKHEVTKDTGTERQRQKSPHDNAKFVHEFDSDFDTRDNRSNSGNQLAQIEDQSDIHKPAYLSPQTHLHIKRSRDRTAYPRRKIVDFLGTSSEGPANEGESNNVLTGSPHGTLNQGYDMSQAPELSNPYEAQYFDTSSIEDPAGPRPTLRGSRVTYARQRSFLNEANIVPATEDQNNNHSKRPRIASHSEINFDDSINEDTGPIRNIHELRHAGDNARFRSAIESILEDVTDDRNSMSSRCNSFLQLSSKLLDRRSARRFAEYGFVENYLECVKGDLDVISASFALCSYELIRLSGGFSHARLVDLWPRLLDLSPRLLDTRDDILVLSKQRRFKISRAVQMSIRETVPVLASVVRHDGAPLILKPCYLALQCIQSALWGFRQHAIVKVIPTTTLDRLINLLTSDYHCEPLILSSSSDAFQMTFSILSILEAYTIILGSLPVDHQDSLKPLSQLHRFISLSDSEFSNRCQSIKTLYIRVILNLTNNDPLFCNNFVTPEILGGLVGIIIRELSVRDSPPEEHSQNTVILALGTLINLTEKSDMARSVFLTAKQDSASFLHLLLHGFSANIGSVSEAHSVHDTHYNVVIGYLSVLLTTLCLNTEAYAQVKSFFGDKGLALVLSTADEFQRYYQRVEEDLHPAEVGGKSMSNFIAQLQNIIYMVRQSEGST